MNRSAFDLRRVFIAALRSLVLGLPLLLPIGNALGEDDGQPRPVALVIDYGDGVQKHFSELEWNQGTTVLDLMRQAQSHPRGIQFKFRGRGATAFLTEIDELSNEGSDGKNWIFRIGGELGKQSFALAPVQRGDRVLWKFERYR